MTRTLLKTLKLALCTATVGLGLAAAPPAMAQVEVSITPPAWYVATNRPVYYEGRANYWYGNRWHYREGRNWRSYRDEPRSLRDRRWGRDHQRYYGRAHRGGYHDHQGNYQRR
ncbi:MAG: hypothetical protein HZB56_18080 [Deltaproteobacteria bacterium]|nr:hypothetical protein [Deltaproteobacteria bacterium]